MFKESCIPSEHSGVSGHVCSHSNRYYSCVQYERLENKVQGK
jgi:hypothetical protein